MPSITKIFGKITKKLASGIDQADKINNLFAGISFWRNFVLFVYVFF